MAGEASSLGEIANNLISSAELVTGLLHAACIALGVGFTLYALIAYRNHHNNPKLTPLDRPIIYLVLGITLTAIPFLGHILEYDTGRAAVHKQGSHGSGNNSDIDDLYHDLDRPY